MQRIHQKIIRALFSALAVSMLLCACDSPNTPQSKPDPAPRPSPSPTPPSTGGSGGGSGSGSGSHGSLQNNQGRRDGGGVQADEGSSTVPSGSTTVKVTVKSVKDNLDGHKKVKKTGGGDAFEGELEVTVNKAAIDAGFVEDTVAELAKELKGKTVDLVAGEIYKFTEDDAATTPVTAASLIGPSKTIHVSKFTEKVTVQVQSITGIANYETVGAPYNAAKLVEGGAIPLNTTPIDYMTAVKKTLADKVASTLDAGADPEGGAPYRIFKVNNATTDITETDLGKDKTVYVAKKKKVQVKITLKLGGATTNKVTKDGHPLKERTVIKPADNDQKGKAIYTAVGAGGQSKMSEAVYEITEEVFKGVADEIMKIITTAGGKLGTKAGEYALFTEQASNTDGKGYIAGLDYSALSSKDLTNLEIYIGYIKS